MLTRVLAGTVAGAVIFFFGGWLVYGIILKSYFEGTMSATAKSVVNAEPNLVPLILAQLAFGALFAYIFDQWATIRTFAGGVKAGAIIMFLLALGFDLQMNAYFKDMHVGSPYTPILVDLIAATVLGAIAGGVIGAVLGMMKKDASAY